MADGDAANPHMANEPYLYVCRQHDPLVTMANRYKPGQAVMTPKGVGTFLHPLCPECHGAMELVVEPEMESPPRGESSGTPIE